MGYKKTLLLCIVLLPMVLFGCATPQADLFVGQTTKADIDRMLGRPTGIVDMGSTPDYNLKYMFYGRSAKIRVVQADGTEMLYELGRGQMTIKMNRKTNILENVTVVGF